MLICAILLIRLFVIVATVLAMSGGQLSSLVVGIIAMILTSNI